MHELTREITGTEIAGYRRDGAVLLKSLLPLDLVEQITEQMDRVRSSPGALTSHMRHQRGGCTTVELSSTTVRPELFALTVNASLGRIAAAVHGGSQWRLIGDQSWIKEAGPMVPTLWHHDQGYSNLAGRDIVRLWIPCDPVPREQALEIVRGSHLWNVEYRPAIDQDPGLVEESGGANAYGSLEQSGHALPAVPDIANHRDSFDIMGWHVEPGDVIAFHFDVLHSSGYLADRSDLRRAFAVILGGADAHLTRRPGTLVPTRADLLNIEYAAGTPVADLPEVFPAVS